MRQDAHLCKRARLETCWRTRLHVCVALTVWAMLANCYLTGRGCSLEGHKFTTKSVTIILRIARRIQLHRLCEVSQRCLGNPNESPFPLARENQANKGLDSLEPMHQSPQALWKRVVAALYACQVGSARIQFLLHVCCSVPL